MKKFYNYFTLLVIAALFVQAAVPAYDASAQGELVEDVELQPDGTSMKDTQLVSSTPTSNFGSGTNFGVGESNSSALISRSIIEFDMSGLPYDATITEATLSLWVDVDQSDNSRVMSVYPMESEWTESQATWNIRKTSTNWQTAGAGGANDAGTTAIGTTTLGASVSSGTRIDIVLDASAVQAMLHQNYFGMKLQMATENDDRYLFKSSDNATAGERPMLTISYYPDTPFVDPGWYCVQGTVGLSTWPTCAPSGPVTTPISPFEDQGQGLTANVTFGGTPNALAEETVAAKLNCTPYPRCLNDYPVHYRITYDAEWIAAGSTNGDLWATLVIPGGTNVQHSVSCGTGVSGGCIGVFDGIISISSLPVNTDGTFTIGLLFGYTFPATWPVTYNQLDWSIYLSLEPYDQTCAETYMVPAPYTFEIDPTIETPVGEPTDYQIFPTEVGALYSVRVENGPWDDGTDPRTDAAVSLNGSTWMSWTDFSFYAECVDTDPVNRDYDVLYFIATTSDFYIRANDTAGNFADNTNDPDTPFQYVIGLALPIDEGECGSQFTFDEVDDLIAEVEVDSTDGDVPVLDDELEDPSEILQVGEWYGIEVVSGTWHEPAGEDSIAMEFVVGTSFGATWTDLAEGSDLVECVVSTDRDIVFIQADDVQLHLRVDDQDVNFANNTGTLNVNVYHAAFDRRSEDCELSFALDDLIRTDSVLASQDQGKVFAFSVGSMFVNQSDQVENFLSYGLVPGAWYALETTGGPWRFGNSPNAVLQGESYDMEIVEQEANKGGTTPEGNWEPLEDWEMAACNVQTDQLGHRLVYFQIPVTAHTEWKLRFNDHDIDWPFVGGSMSWNLYRLIDLGVSYNGQCDYTYDAEAPLSPAPYTVNANSVVGVPLPLAVDSYYAVEILGEDYQWQEESGDEDRTDMEISLNNGQIWGDLPGHGALCSVDDGDNLIFFISTGQDTPYFKLRVNSESFGDNTGQMGWNIYPATAGPSVNPWDGCVSAGYSNIALSPKEWIPVADEQGRMLTSTSASYAEIGGLVAGNRYIVETVGGPWYDSGEQTVEHAHWGAEVSSDGGTTWQAMNGTNTDISCWEVSHDLNYRKIEFIVEPGQVWKIRVADTGDWTDNTGNLAYSLQGEVLPEDTVIQGHLNLPGCATPPILPDPMEADDLLNVGNYLGGWIDYASAVMVGFLSWCPEHTASLSVMGSSIQDREPFATFNEIDGVLNSIKLELNGYSWGSPAEDYSILDKSPAQSAAMIEQYVFGPLPDDSPWMGGDLVDFSATPEPGMYTASCELSVVDYIGEGLSKGVCFASNWAREVGFSFWMQLMLDVTVIFGCIGAGLNEFKRLLYLFTGVNLSIQKNDSRVFINYLQGSDNERRGRR